MMTTSLSIQRPLWGPPLRLHPSRTALWGIQASIHCFPSPLYWTFYAFGCEREEGCGAWRLWARRRLITFFAMLSCPRHGTAILGLCWFPNAGLLIRLGWQFGARGQQGMGWVNRLDWILYMLPLLLAIVKAIRACFAPSGLEDFRWQHSKLYLGLHFRTPQLYIYFKYTCVITHIYVMKQLFSCST